MSRRNLQQHSRDSLAEIAKNTRRTTEAILGSGTFSGAGIASEATLTVIEAYMLKEVWATIPGNSVAYTYYSGVVAGNPSGNANLETAAYSNAGGVVYTQTFTYDVNDNVINIVTT
jgi:hypothetical protein